MGFGGVWGLSRGRGKSEEEEEENDDDNDNDDDDDVDDDDDDDIRLAKENWCVGLGGPGRGKVWVSRPGVHCHPHHCNQHHCHHDHQSGS